MNQEKLFTQLLYSRDHERNKPWTGIGSAVFAYLDGAFYLLTAAHVFLENKGYACILNINGTPLDLAHYKVEKYSDMDIAAIRLEECDYIAIAEHTLFVTEDMLQEEEILAKEIILMGYPRSRNKSKFRDTGFQPTVWRHNTIDCSEKLELKNETYRPIYFAAAYDPKNTENEHGQKERTPDRLNGISGGIALEFTINATDTIGFAPLGMIQGMNHKSKLIYGVTFKYLFAWLRKNSDNFLHQRNRPQSSPAEI